MIAVVLFLRRVCGGYSLIEHQLRSQLLSPDALSDQLSELRVPGGSDKLRKEGKALVYKTLELLSSQHSDGSIQEDAIGEYIPVYDKFAPHITKLRKKLCPGHPPKEEKDRNINHERRRSIDCERVYVISDEARAELRDDNIFKSLTSRLFLYPGIAATTVGVGTLVASAVTWDAAVFEVGRMAFFAGTGALCLSVGKAFLDFVWDPP